MYIHRRQVCDLDPYREYFKPDIFSFGGDKVNMDFRAAHKSFDVYRIKIFENRDREEDVEAKCRHYSCEAGLTYKDCVLTSIKNDFEVSKCKANFFHTPSNIICIYTSTYVCIL